MLKHLTSPKTPFKPIAFTPGLNILVADKTDVSSSTDSRNGSGKSSIIELLHFQLGMTRLTGSVLNGEALRGCAFTLRLDWPGHGKPIAVTRDLSKKSRVSLDPNVAEPSSGLLDDGDVATPVWVNAIGRDLFGLPAEHDRLSARTLLAYYIRRVSQHSFNDPVKTFATQSAADASANVAYLLGLNWRLAGDYQSLAARDAVRKKLKQATKDPAFNLVVGTVSELRGQLAGASRRVQTLEEQVKQFRVVPEYENLQSRADEIDSHIRGLRIRDSADRRNLKELEEAIRNEDEPDVSYLERAYRELGVELPERVMRRYAEVEQFHIAVVSNRRSYLEEELKATRHRLEARQEERDALGMEQAKLLRDLNSGGALDALGALQEQLAIARAAQATLQSRFETAKHLEATQAEIRFERSKLQQDITRDLAEREAQITEINNLFQRFAAALYGAEREAYIGFSALETSLQITPHIGGENSEGIGKMVIFCFDLTFAVLAHRNGRGPDFLVHDSHLFDGVDERQISKALSLAAEVCLEENLQYIVTMNSDELSKVESVGTSFNRHIIAPRLTDAYDNGGLFGFRFE